MLWLRHICEVGLDKKKLWKLKYLNFICNSSSSFLYGITLSRDRFIWATFLTFHIKRYYLTWFWGVDLRANKQCFKVKLGQRSAKPINTLQTCPSIFRLIEYKLWLGLLSDLTLRFKFLQNICHSLKNSMDRQSSEKTMNIQQLNLLTFAKDKITSCLMLFEFSFHPKNKSSRSPIPDRGTWPFIVNRYQCI